MAILKGGLFSVCKTIKKTSQGMGRGTKFNNTVGSNPFKKKYRGQGK